MSTAHSPEPPATPDVEAGCCSTAPPATAHEIPPGYRDHRAAHLRRLRLIEGQVRALHRMIEEDVYCVDVLTQMSAATRALQSLALALADQHIHHCVRHAAESGDSAEIDQKLDEVMTVMKRLVR